MYLEFTRTDSFQKVGAILGKTIQFALGVMRYTVRISTGNLTGFTSQILRSYISSLTLFRRLRKDSLGAFLNFAIAQLPDLVLTK